ncbi:MAG: hypothetical protein GY913_16655 [Proteobacteria bacterium]|nr:hypothetical protein [Pseudomonadota bacterium]MCP4918536.1 hypothetical protein [Pseudomonadota bacterium]
MASTKKTTTIPGTPEAVMALAERAGERLTQYDFKGRQGTEIVWERGFGLTNPQTVRARFWGEGDVTCVEYEVSIMALMDPFGFTGESADRFIAELQAHHAQEQDGAQLPMVPPDKRGKNILIGSIVFAGLFVGCSGIVMVFAMLS